MHIVSSCMLASGVTLALGLASSPASAQTLQWLGAASLEYRDGANVSADGSTVAFRDDSGDARRWTAASGSQLLGIAGRPKGVSSDGATVVGTAVDVYTFGQALRWTEAGGLDVIPVSPSVPKPAGSYATGVSSAGRVSGNASAPYDAPAFWDSAGAQTEIGAGGADFQTTNIARDASVIVGTRVSGACGQQCAMRWDASGGSYTGPASFATNPNSGSGVELATSNGGTVIVGVDSTNDLKGWAWSQATGAVLLDTGGDSRHARGVFA